MVPEATVRTYYDKPVVKEPVWRWYVPAYFFTGGVAAGSSLLAFGGRLTGNRRLARQSRLVSLAALPILPDPSWKPTDGANPIFRILGLLAVTIGMTR